MVDLTRQLENNTYPGRGIVLGRSADGSKAVIAYFIMGRSVNSRNRVFVEDGDGLRTKAYDPSKLSDPSLVIYAPVRVFGDVTVVTNGDQTDTVTDAMTEAFPEGDSTASFESYVKVFESALRTRTFEPDGPNYTPRISGMVQTGDGACAYAMSILKSDEQDPDHAQRFFYEYEAPAAGKGHFIHTYSGDGEPLPSFMGEPEIIDLSKLTKGNDIDGFTDAIWKALNSDNRVSLFTRFIDIESGNTESRIVNVNTEEV